MGEFPIIESFPVWKAIAWCFYPFAIFLVIDFIAEGFDDDDDQGGGMMIPAYQGSRG